MLMTTIFKKLLSQFVFNNKNLNMSSDDIPIEGNGNIIFGCEIPDEILLQIFENLDDYILVKYVPLVCRHWHELSKTWHLWKARLRRRNVKVSEGRMDRFLSSWDDPLVVATVQWLCVNSDRKPVNFNVLKNPSGEQGFSHWKVQHGGDNIIVEETPFGCDPIPEESGLPTQHCFVSSYALCKRSQSVSLYRDLGFKPFVLQVLEPSLIISEWVSARFDCGAQSMIQVSVIGKNEKPAVFITRWKDSDFGRVEWYKMWKKVNYEELPDGMHTIHFKNLSQDTQFWAGHYGAKTAGSSVVLDISTD
ncbi:F-box only protein 6 [Armadillidium vulgare]|nr:F-box only protein 6 [Armadillidium vulgare]